MPILHAAIRRHILREWTPGIATALLATILIASGTVFSLHYPSPPSRGIERSRITSLTDVNILRSEHDESYYLSVRIEGRTVSHFTDRYTGNLFSEGQTVRVNYTVTPEGVYTIQEMNPVDQMSLSTNR